MDEFYSGKEHSFNDWKWKRTVEQQPVVYQLRSTLATDATNLKDAERSLVALIAYEDAENTIDAEKDQVSKLVQDWKFPKTAVQSIMKKGVPRGFYRHTNASHRCFWYYIAIARPYLDASLYDIVRVCAIYDTATSVSRTLIFCPRCIIDKATEALQIACNAESNTDKDIVDWAIPHLLIAHLCTTEWENEEGRIRSMVNTSTVVLNANADPGTDNEPIAIIDRELHRVYWSAFYSSTLDSVLPQLGQEFGMFQVSQTCPTTRILEDLERFSTKLNSTHVNIEFFDNTLKIERQKFLSMITLKNAGYTRRIATALLKLSQNSSEDAQEMKRQSQQALESSKLMTKISYLSMFYLPATFLATLFSTPFFQINQELQFPALTKLWIYFLFAVILTTVTFLASTLWDIVRDRSNDRTNVQSDPVSSTQDIEDISTDPDRSLLEPGPSKLDLNALTEFAVKCKLMTINVDGDEQDKSVGNSGFEDVFSHLHEILVTETTNNQKFD